MNLPNLSAPVVRNANARFSTESVNPSNLACDACRTACNLAPAGPFGVLRKACLAACNATVC